MKVIQLINSREYMVEDDEAEYIKGLLSTGKVQFINLTNGTMINISSISVIGDLEKEKVWEGYILDRDGRWFVRDGQRIYLEGNEKIEERTHRKYASMNPIKLLR